VTINIPENILIDLINKVECYNAKFAAQDAMNARQNELNAGLVAERSALIEKVSELSQTILAQGEELRVTRGVADGSAAEIVNLKNDKQDMVVRNNTLQDDQARTRGILNARINADLNSIESSRKTWAIVCGFFGGVAGIAIGAAAGPMIFTAAPLFVVSEVAAVTGGGALFGVGGGILGVKGVAPLVHQGLNRGRVREIEELRQGL
jgi:hypothetical protein